MDKNKEINANNSPYSFILGTTYFVSFWRQFSVQTCGKLFFRKWVLSLLSLANDVRSIALLNNK